MHSDLSYYGSADASKVANWTRMEVMLEAKSSNTNSRLQLTTTKTGVLWIDQVSAMPTDTYKVILPTKNSAIISSD